MPDLAKANEARLRAALDRRWRFNHEPYVGVRSMRDMIALAKPYRKSAYGRNYETHKRDGTYARLAETKWMYTLWFCGPDGEDSGFDVPKVIYDSLDLPDRRSEE